MLPYLFYPLLAATILFVGALVFFVFSKQKDFKTNLARNLFIIATVIFVMAIFVCVFLHIRYRYKLSPDHDDVFFIHPLYFYPLLASVGAIILAFGFYVFSKMNDRLLNVAKWSFGGVVLASFITLIVCMQVYYKREIAIDAYYSPIKSGALIGGAIGLAALIAIIAIFFGRRSQKALDSKSLSYGAICLAMSFSLSYIKLWAMPQGGSITLVSLLPLMFYSQMFGVRKGVFLGSIYGVLQAIQDTWILHPMQFLLDYPIAFACIGLTSLFTQGGIKGKKGIVLFAAGAVLAVTMRYFSHVISGIFAFSMFAKKGYSAVAWGFLYNTFAFADMALALAIGVLMLGNGSFRKLLNRITISAVEPLKSSRSNAEAKIPAKDEVVTEVNNGSEGQN